MTRRRRLVTLIVSALALGAAVAPGAAQATDLRDPLQWEVLYTNTIKIDEEYQLHNIRRHELRLSSQFGFRMYERTLAADVPDAGFVRGGHFVFKRPNPRDHRSVRPGENVAIYNTKVKKYLGSSQFRYVSPFTGSRSRKIQRWSDTPNYDWQLQQIRPGDGSMQFALFNYPRNDHFVLDVDNESREFLRDLGRR
jgi:hypothetical protein